MRWIRQIATPLGISLQLEPRWRGAELAELLDERHAVLVRKIVAGLTAAGWQSIPERTFNQWGEKGAIDVLAWQPSSRSLLVVEVKTKLADLQDLLSTMDRKRRLAPTLAKDLGWKPLAIGSVLVVPDETWARNAIARFKPVFAAALPARTPAVRDWPAEARGDLRGIWFVLNDAPGSAKRRPGGSMRVRPRKPTLPKPPPRSLPGPGRAGPADAATSDNHPTSLRSPG